MGFPFYCLGSNEVLDISSIRINNIGDNFNPNVLDRGYRSLNFNDRVDLDDIFNIFIVIEVIVLIFIFKS